MLEKREPSYTVGENANWCSHNGKLYVVSQETKVELPYDPAISLLGIYPEKNMTPKDRCTPTLTAALFTTAKTWKQPKRPRQQNG